MLTTTWRISWNVKILICTDNSISTWQMRQESVIISINLVAEYREAMGIKAQFEKLVKQLAENDSDASNSQKSHHSDYSDHANEEALNDGIEQDRDQADEQRMSFEVPAESEDGDDDVIVIMH
jgi:hypothetical protein